MLNIKGFGFALLAAGSVCAALGIAGLSVLPIAQHHGTACVFVIAAGCLSIFVGLTMLNAIKKSGATAAFEFSHLEINPTTGAPMVSPSVDAQGYTKYEIPSHRLES